MGGPLRIRAARPADAEAIAAIYAYYVLTGPITFEIDPPSAAEMARRMTDILPHHPYLVAELDGGIAGYAYATRLYERAAYRWAVEATVYVAPGSHRQGIGAALYRALIASLGEQGFRTVIGKITLPNPASVRLHESLGFVCAGVLAKIGFKQGGWHDVGIYQLDLGGHPVPPPEPRPFLPAG
ncbi:GNAT family N-acetyltransferase [Sphingomonas sp. YL-JM2C]